MGGEITCGKVVGIGGLAYEMLVGIVFRGNVSVAVGTMCADDELSIIVVGTKLDDIDDIGCSDFRIDHRHLDERFGV